MVTDHQPLESLWKSNRKPSLRLERIQLRHQHISYEVKWRKGNDNPADYLSRHAIPLECLPQHIREEAKIYEKLIYILHTTPYTNAISPSCIYDAQSQDHQLQKLLHLIHLGEPPSNNPDLKPFKNTFSELSISDGGLILRGEKIVLPATLHEEAVHLAHRGGHPGQSHVKRCLRAHFWFPGMDKYIEHQLESCHQCQLHTQSAMKAPLTPAPVPSKPWDDVSLDHFQTTHTS